VFKQTLEFPFDPLGNDPGFRQLIFEGLVDPGGIQSEVVQEVDALKCRRWVAHLKDLQRGTYQPSFPRQSQHLVGGVEERREIALV